MDYPMLGLHNTFCHPAEKGACITSTHFYGMWLSLVYKWERPNIWTFHYIIFSEEFFDIYYLCSSHTQKKSLKHFQNLSQCSTVIVLWVSRQVVYLRSHVTNYRWYFISKQALVAPVSPILNLVLIFILYKMWWFLEVHIQFLLSPE